MFDRIPTLADVCSAIAEGQIAFSLDGTAYQINAMELRRFLNKFRGLPSLSSLPPANTPDSVTHTCTDSWESPVQPSVA